MINFSEVKFEEFKELVEFLKFNDNDEEGFNISKRLTRFIEQMSGMQMVIINNIVDHILKGEISTAEANYKSFHLTYPDTQFDPEGKLDMDKIDYFEVKLQSCEVLYERAKYIIDSDGEIDKFEYDINKQICDAKTLEPLIKMNGQFEYILHRALYYKQNPDRPISMEQFKDADKKIKELIGGENNIMGKFLNYIFKLKPEKCRFFIEHFLARLDVLYKDKNLEHPLNKEFKENLMKIG